MPPTGLGLTFLSGMEGRPYVRRKCQVDFYVFEASENRQQKPLVASCISRNPDQFNQTGIALYKVANDLPTGISVLEARSSNDVLAMVRSATSRQWLSRRDDRQVPRVFLSSTRKLRQDLEAHLRIAKAERAHEVLRLRLQGARFEAGTIPLRAVASLITPFNAVLEQSAWRFWDRSGDAARIDQKFVRQLDLRLASLETGSTEVVILGNTAPDLSGTSALESALRDVFDLLHADVEDFAERVHTIGIQASKSMADFLSRIESESLSVDLEWRASDSTYRWNGRAAEVTRIRTLLDDIGDPVTTVEKLAGTVNVLSVRNRLEIQDRETGEKVRLSYHNALADSVRELRLGDERLFQVERTIYPFVASKRKRDTFRLQGVVGRAGE